MTDIAEVTSAAPSGDSAGRKRRGSGLDSMVLPELKQLASTLGLKGTGAMRKSQLIDAIQSVQNGSSGNRAPSGPPPTRTDDVAAALDTLQQRPRETEGQPTLPATEPNATARQPSRGPSAPLSGARRPKASGPTAATPTAGTAATTAGMPTAGTRTPPGPDTAAGGQPRAGSAAASAAGLGQPGPEPGLG